nr:nitroreductase family protein [Candidatus Sigynarchaeota archaeon]
MDFYELVNKRKSIRKYKPDLVDNAILGKILDAARMAPTWANMQGVRYIIVNKKEKVEEIKAAIGQKWLSSVPMFIVATIKESDSGKNKNGQAYFMLDVGICFEHLVLAATNEGLGTCWIGYFDEEKVKSALNIPGKSRVVAITPLGYPDEEAK